jgi:molecular chaperone HscB
MQADLGKNYFELFGLPVSYDIDLTDLSSRYRELQRRFHPDRYAAAPESERRLSVQMTAQINAAYQTLRDRVARGRYLLGLKGVLTNEETDTRMDPAFLMEQMELRELLDDAREASDREARCAVLQERVDALLDSKTALLQQNISMGTEPALQTARGLVREMQFLQKLTHEIEMLD